jgi:small subunit ribosomal protein S21
MAAVRRGGVRAPPARSEASGQAEWFLLSQFPTVRRSVSARNAFTNVVAPFRRRFDAKMVKPLEHQETGVQVLVRDNNVDQALKALKKKMQREGIFREMKLRGHYEKPSEKRAREQAEAVRRARKLARKKMQREGLLPMKAKPAAR